MKPPLSLPPRTGARPSAVRGFTLVELMVALAMLAVLMAVAAPDFREAAARARITGAANELLAAVQLARTEAVRQNQRVVLCKSADGSACSTATGAWAGWIVFEDKDNDGVRDTDEPVIKSGTFDSPVTVLPSAAITSLSQRMVFRGDGLARASDNRTLLAASLAVCVAVPRPTENVRDVLIGGGSRTSLRRRAGAGACTTPADS